MSKELTPLQALDSIIETFIDKDSEDIKTVRTALRALEIIKDKVAPLVNLDTIDIGDGSNKLKYRVYDNELYAYRPLTEEEYELLKEVLIWNQFY